MKYLSHTRSLLVVLICSLFWHRLWVDIGRPPTGVVATVMRNTRYKYHKAVKDIKRNDLNVRKAKLAEMANESYGRALWDELKRLKRGVKCTTNTLDGHSTNADIVEHLVTKYRALFSSQTTTEAKLNDIRHVMQDKVTCEGNDFVVTVTEVCEMTSKLKINKSDGMTGTCSDHFVYAPHRFAVLFTMLINVMLVHGYMPDDMLASVLVSPPRYSLHRKGTPFVHRVAYLSTWVASRVHDGDVQWRGNDFSTGWSSVVCDPTFSSRGCGGHCRPPMQRPR